MCMPQKTRSCSEPLKPLRKLVEHMFEGLSLMAAVGRTYQRDLGSYCISHAGMYLRRSKAALLLRRPRIKKHRACRVGLLTLLCKECHLFSRQMLWLPYLEHF